MVTFIEQTSVPCDPASLPYPGDRTGVRSRFSLGSTGWPSGYSGNVYMEPQGDSTWAVMVKIPASTPANPFLAVYVIDHCLLPPDAGPWGPWGVHTATGLSVEPEGHPELRVRLRDATDMTEFKFVPPDTIIPR